MNKQDREIIAFFNAINPLKTPTAEALVSLFKPCELTTGDYFIREGQYAQTIGFLRSGVIRSYFIDAKGKEYNKQLFRAPCLIGAYSSLLTKKPNQIAQQALLPSEVWVADYIEIEKLYDQFHDLERLGRKIAEHYFFEKEKKEIEMAVLDAEDRYRIFRDSFPGLEQQISLKHIANYLGISQTQLSRIRKKMR